MRLASTAMTTHWEPKWEEASFIKAGLTTAAVFKETLSAPANNKARMSSIVRIPPPTVKGMKTSLATRSTTSSIVLRPSFVAVISKKTSSSAPSCEYFFAKETGSPAYFRLLKLTPLTVWPSLTSRQGMMRFVIMISLPSVAKRHSRPVRFFRDEIASRRCCRFQRPR